MRLNKPESQTASSSGGFTLVELMVAIAIVGVLLSLAVPSISDYIANARLRAEAQNMLVGLQKARTEAVQRNLPVEFVLTNAVPAAIDPATGVANGANWVIQTANPRVFIEGKLGAETGANSDVRINDTDADGAADAGAVAAITFNGTGGTNLAANAMIRLTSTLAACANPAARSAGDFPGSAQAPATSDLRCLDIVVTRGGAARLCDPAVVPSAADTRSCS